ncbi:hypothetical protein DH2020_044180 [Rehmannia glutinosa]|uniref:Uncharacterized protein n=1 Tax=Rehmannia glutinosa TaxID=99300 RepID=A0ABR0UHQ3_REHGL
MREINSRNNEEQKPTTTLRRSPRFLHGRQTCVEYPGTPKPAARKTRIPPDSFFTPLCSSITRTQKNGSGISKKGGKKGTDSNCLTEPSNGSRRSARLDRIANLSSLDFQEQYLSEKRVTRSSVRGSRFVNCQLNECEKNSRKGDREVTNLKYSEKSGRGSSRSARFDSRANASKKEEVVDSQKQFVIEKRMTRSSVCRSKFVNNDFNSEKDSGKRVSVLSKEGKAKVGVDFCKESIGNFEKRVTRSTSRTKTIRSVEKTEKVNNVSTDRTRKLVIFDERKLNGDGELSKAYVSKRDANDCGKKRTSGDKNCERKMQIGEKRKRNQVEKECDYTQGWTEEQELALRRAYFTAKPTPHFWKKVARMEIFIHTVELFLFLVELYQLLLLPFEQSLRFLYCRSASQQIERSKESSLDHKLNRFPVVRSWAGLARDEQQSRISQNCVMVYQLSGKPQLLYWLALSEWAVPGKSAEECFDRIHSDHLTPSQPRKRSRANRKEPSPLSFSASKLLSPAEIKTKRLRTKRKTLLAQKTVRQLLQKQRNEDQNYEADLFSVLETTMEPSSLDFQDSTSFASPKPNRGSGILTRCKETSSSAHKKQRSRLTNSHKAAFVSPPVLKQVKNKALHEKYIDQLHCRDAKRKAESLRNGKCIQDIGDKKASESNVDWVKVAKDALVFDVQDAIDKFRTLQSSTNCDIDDDDIISRNDEDEDDELL